MPGYNFPMRILKTSSKVCARDTQHDLVIVGKSGNLWWDARTAFRAFMQRERARYPKLKVGVVFSLGMPREHGDKIFNRDGHIFRQNGTAGDRMEKCDGKADVVMEHINQEIHQFDNILLRDYEDTYYNLTWKTVMNLRWLSAFCSKHHANDFMLIDDDHRMNLSLVTQFPKNTSSRTLRRSIFGAIAKKQRSRKNAFKEVVSSRMASIRADIVDDMAIASAYTRYNYAPEDVYLGMVAFKLGINLHRVNSMSYPLWNQQSDTWSHRERQMSTMI
ncbi:unnamed protein product [Mesocestoides corti]|uniref:Hexosyltransferase n=1 Tax=Mesocestoides corti TaxID=53468 RepID=A0A0R3U7Z2_MESCO|nr:unnamed protein product [Mesocestoides corti]